MKHLRRHILNGLIVLSLLLAIATAALWVRSEYRIDRYFLVKHSEEATFSWFYSHDRGSLSIGRRIAKGTASVGPFDTPNTRFHTYAVDSVINPSPRNWGFDRVNRTLVIGDTLFTILSIAVPFWFVFTVFIAMPAVHSVILVRRRRFALPGHCPACGYDMRANPAKCSECGHETKPVTT